jgi:hypothetical protein
MLGGFGGNGAPVGGRDPGFVGKHTTLEKTFFPIFLHTWQAKILLNTIL